MVIKRTKLFNQQTQQSIDEGGMYTIPLDGLCAISVELQISNGDIIASASICD